ncbi:acetyltransferase [Thermodesulfobacteriota bacterium]
MNKLAIFGSNNLGQLIAYHAINDARYNFVGFFDNKKMKGSRSGIGSIIGDVNDVERLYSQKFFDCLMIGVGYYQFDYRRKVYELFKNIIPFANIIHTSSYIDDSCVLGEGIFILPGCVLDKGVELEDNVLLNTGCTIAHDSIIKKHSFIAPSVNIAGHVIIGESCFIGIGTTIIDNIQISANTQTGGGAVIINNIDKPGLYVGVPGFCIREY